ncbi:MAG: O-GlcNAcase NagJ precursor [Verrucomicrobiota bacterium]
MAHPEPPNFLAGVIEGFYGQPWNQAERLQLFERMAAWGLNTYLYAPKDDLKHRAWWRELYTPEQMNAFADLLAGCQTRGLQFIYALSPGLDIRYGEEAELEKLRQRFAQMLAAGCRHFALLFDDIPDRMNPADRERFGSCAAAQCHVTNAMARWIQERSPGARLLFCPTPYCGRMAERNLGGANYLETIGRDLRPEIDICWTGPEIVSREIALPPLHALTRLLRRQPIIWDNLYANDYDGRRFYAGPYAGRPPELRGAVRGVFLNPNCEFALNFVPLRTFAEFLRCPGTWEPRAAYLSAMSAWWPHFATAGQPVALADLVLLIDGFYLPFSEGAAAEEFFQQTRTLLVNDPATWGEDAVAFLRSSARLRELCTRLADLIDRPLFYALSRRIWELREELDLLERYVNARMVDPLARVACHSDFHLPGTYRGGLVSKLQGLLAAQPDGSFDRRRCHE